MFKHRRVRVTCVLAVGWVFFAVVERQSGQTTWPASLLHALVWALAVSGTWWFAEMTQLGPRTARPVPSASATANSSRGPGVSTAAHDTAPTGHPEEDGAPGKGGDPWGRGPATGRARKGGRHSA
ncbi:hypothetical protein AB0N31_01495 [Streptomyces sp. NPDC051051]|uniref:hypothetical protein n=1 Tax=Streptomyces sp. NPDC051051 TaxID=3155666 RepID=UPI00341FB412